MTEKQIFDFFRKEGLTFEGACGLMGNLEAESGLKFDAIEISKLRKMGITAKQYIDSVDSGFYKNFVNDGVGTGISQTTYWTRKQALLNFAKKRGVSIADPQMQLDFLMQELKTSFKAVYKVLTTTTSVQKASDTVLTQFEKPADQSTAVKNKRLMYSEGYFKKFNESKPIQKVENKLVINKDYPCHKSNYGGKRDLEDIQWIVLHYTGNKTDKAVNNAKYFNRTANIKCSAHYFVDDSSIYQSVADDDIAWAVGKLYSSKNGGGKYFSKCKNANSISIEMCSQNGAITNATIDRAVELVKMLMKKYYIPVSNIVTHFLVCGKNCPGWTLNTPQALEAFKAKTAGITTPILTEPYKKVQIAVKTSLNIRSGPGTAYVPIGKLYNGEIVEVVEEKNGFYRLRGTQDSWICKQYVKEVR